MCFYGEWFGKPYDNFHRIIRSRYENDCLEIYFDHNEVLSIFHPSGITSDAKHLEIINASKVIWRYIPYVSRGIAKECIYTSCKDGVVLKTTDNAKKFFLPKENIAVQCL